MSRPVKRLLVLLGFVLLAGCLWFGYQLLRIHAACQHVVWQAEEGGLTLTYFPLKDDATMLPGANYKPGGTLTWTMTHPGSTNWIIAAPRVPAPEKLFGRAYIPRPDEDVRGEPQPDPQYGLMSSSARGMVRLYADVSDNQRLNIVDKLEFACEQYNSFCEEFQEVQALSERRSTIHYIDDPGSFKGEDDPALTPDESKAIMTAKRHLERLFGKQIRATFTVSSDDWGYQVDLTDLHCVVYPGSRWERIVEGFGEVFLSTDFDVIEADIGP